MSREAARGSLRTAGTASSQTLEGGPGHALLPARVSASLPLPSHYEALMVGFDKLDATVCLLQRRHLTCSLATVIAMAWVGRSTLSSLSDLCRLIISAPDVFSVRPLPRAAAAADSTAAKPGWSAAGSSRIAMLLPILPDIDLSKRSSRSELALLSSASSSAVNSASTVASAGCSATSIDEVADYCRWTEILLQPPGGSAAQVAKRRSQVRQALAFRVVRAHTSWWSARCGGAVGAASSSAAGRADAEGGEGEGVTDHAVIEGAADASSDVPGPEPSSNYAAKPKRASKAKAKKGASGAEASDADWDVRKNGWHPEFPLNDVEVVPLPPLAFLPGLPESLRRQLFPGAEAVPSDSSAAAPLSGKSSDEVTIAGSGALTPPRGSSAAASSDAAVMLGDLAAAATSGATLQAVNRVALLMGSATALTASPSGVARMVAAVASASMRQVAAKRLLLGPTSATGGQSLPLLPAGSASSSASSASAMGSSGTNHVEHSADTVDELANSHTAATEAVTSASGPSTTGVPPSASELSSAAAPTGIADQLRMIPGYIDQIVHVHTLPARPARFESDDGGDDTALDGASDRLPAAGLASSSSGALAASSGGLAATGTGATSAAAPHAVRARVLRQLHPAVREALAARGITRLFTHQAAAIAAALQGKHAVISTSTSSGKSLAYLVPTFQSLLPPHAHDTHNAAELGPGAYTFSSGAGSGAGTQHRVTGSSGTSGVGLDSSDALWYSSGGPGTLSTPPSTSPSVSLLLFPTKALAQDQLRGLREFSAGSLTLSAHVRAAVLDGDTGWSERAAIRAEANIILTNPDLLHATLLPQHKEWRRIFTNLRLVALDEAHVYRGVFGCHVALVLRRLMRLAAHYGARPQFVCCSATIANPLQHFRALVPRWPMQPDPPVASASASGSTGRATAAATAGDHDDVVVITNEQDGSAAGERTIIIWNPPLIAGNTASAAKPEDASEEQDSDGSGSGSDIQRSSGAAHTSNDGASDTDASSDSDSRDAAEALSATGALAGKARGMPAAKRARSIVKDAAGPESGPATHKRGSRGHAAVSTVTKGKGGDSEATDVSVSTGSAASQVLREGAELAQALGTAGVIAVPGDHVRNTTAGSHGTAAAAGQDASAAAQTVGSKRKSNAARRRGSAVQVPAATGASVGLDIPRPAGLDAEDPVVAAAGNLRAPGSDVFIDSQDALPQSTRASPDASTASAASAAAGHREALLSPGRSAGEGPTGSESAVKMDQIPFSSSSSGAARAAAPLAKARPLVRPPAAPAVDETGCPALPPNNYGQYDVMREPSGKSGRRGRSKGGGGIPVFGLTGRRIFPKRRPQMLPSQPASSSAALPSATADISDRGGDLVTDGGNDGTGTRQGGSSGSGGASVGKPSSRMRAGGPMDTTRFVRPAHIAPGSYRAGDKARPFGFGVDGSSVSTASAGVKATEQLTRRTERQPLPVRPIWGAMSARPVDADMPQAIMPQAITSAQAGEAASADLRRSLVASNASSGSGYRHDIAADDGAGGVATGGTLDPDDIDVDIYAALGLAAPGSAPSAGVGYKRNLGAGEDAAAQRRDDHHDAAESSRHASSSAKGSLAAATSGAELGKPGAELAPASESALGETHPQENGQSTLPPAGFVPKWVERWRQHKDADYPPRRSPIVETATLLAALVMRGTRTLAFCRVRKVAELLLQYVHERLASEDAALTRYAAEAEAGSGAGSSGAGSSGAGSSGAGAAGMSPFLSNASTTGARPLSLIARVKSYRAGYLKEHRRAIESDLFAGRLLGVVATNALELGVDVGSLDCVLILGAPSSTASFWQQMGRAGRGGRAGLCILVTYDSPVDQHWVRHPGHMLAKTPEAALVDISNPRILRSHVLCAGAELPLHPIHDVALFGEALGHVVARLRSEDALLPLTDAEAARYIAASRFADGTATAAAAAAGEHDSGIASHMSPTELLAATQRSVAQSLHHPQLGRLLLFGTATWLGNVAATVSLRSIDSGIYRVIDIGPAGRVPSAADVAAESGLTGAAAATALALALDREFGAAGRSGSASAGRHSRNGRSSAGFGAGSSSGGDGDLPGLTLPAGLKLVDEVEESRAYWEVHEGAVYMNQGATYRVLRMDTEARVSWVRQSAEQFYTSLRDHCNVNALSRESVNATEFAGLLGTVAGRHDDDLHGSALQASMPVPLSDAEGPERAEGVAAPDLFIGTGTGMLANTAVSEPMVPRAPSQMLQDVDEDALFSLGTSYDSPVAVALHGHGTADSSAAIAHAGHAAGHAADASSLVNTFYGRAQVMFYAWGYRKIWKRSGAVFETCDLTLPPLELHTTALWTDLSLRFKRWLDLHCLDFLGGCHGAAHAVMAVLPRYLLADRCDVGTECPSPLQHRARPLRFIIYDAAPGGVGITAASFIIARTLYRAALQLIEDCPCDDGCPACIFDLHCREFNYVLDKAAAAAVLRYALGLSLEGVGNTGCSRTKLLGAAAATADSVGPA